MKEVSRFENPLQRGSKHRTPQTIQNLPSSSHLSREAQRRIAIQHSKSILPRPANPFILSKKSFMNRKRQCKMALNFYTERELQIIRYQ
jgi:hypothetical protein